MYKYQWQDLNVVDTTWGSTSQATKNIKRIFRGTRSSVTTAATSDFVQQKNLHCSTFGYNQFRINISRHCSTGQYNFIYRNAIYDFNYTRISMFKLLVAKQSVLSGVICKCKGQVVRIGLAHNRICPIVKLLAHTLCSDVRRIYKR